MNIEILKAELQHSIMTAETQEDALLAANVFTVIVAAEYGNSRELAEVLKDFAKRKIDGLKDEIKTQSN